MHGAAELLGREEALQLIGNFIITHGALIKAHVPYSLLLEFVDWLL